MTKFNVLLKFHSDTVFNGVVCAENEFQARVVAIGKVQEKFELLKPTYSEVTPA
jgi:hypothetical protein